MRCILQIKDTGDSGMGGGHHPVPQSNSWCRKKETQMFKQLDNTTQGQKLSRWAQKMVSQNSLRCLTL